MAVGMREVQVDEAARFCKDHFLAFYQEVSALRGIGVADGYQHLLSGELLPFCLLSAP
jgi:hypothetical protein